jgi:hypothetical protein
MSRQSINSETAETSTEEGTLLSAGTVSLSPTVEFFLLFALTLAGALSLVVLF